MSAGVPGAVVFDFDGTTVDSEGVSRAAMTQVLAEDGLALTDEDYAAIVGRAWPHTRAWLAERVGHDDEALEGYRSRFRDAFRSRLDHVGVFDDVRRTLDRLAVLRVPVGVCTSSGRTYLDRVLSRTGLAERFTATVTREDTTEHKPLPAPYLLVAERLGVPPARCVAVEDTPSGVASARAAGMRVVGVDRLGLDLSGAHRVVTRVTPQVLGVLIA